MLKLQKGKHFRNNLRNSRGPQGHPDRTFHHFLAWKDVFGLHKIANLLNFKAIKLRDVRLGQPAIILTSLLCSCSCFFRCLSLTTWFLRASQVARGILGRSMNRLGSFSRVGSLGPPPFWLFWGAAEDSTILVKSLSKEKKKIATECNFDEKMSGKNIWLEILQ